MSYPDCHQNFMFHLWHLFSSDLWEYQLSVDIAYLCQCKHNLLGRDNSQTVNQLPSVAVCGHNFARHSGATCVRCAKVSDVLQWKNLCTSCKFRSWTFAEYDAQPFLTSCRRAAARIKCHRPSLQVVTRYTSCTHMDRSPLLYVHVGLPVQPTKAAWWPWPFTFWHCKRCPSHVWRGLPLCQF